MANNLLDILNQRDDLTEEELLQYLQGNLTPEERNAVEQRLASSDMMSDAEEGLRLADEKKMRHAVADLNKQLSLQLQHQRRKRKHKQIPNQSLIIVATFIIVGLIVLGFLVIYKMKNG